MTVRASTAHGMGTKKKSPTCGNSQSKTIRFDDRQSLERARHELKKKITVRAKCLIDFARLHDMQVITGQASPRIH